MVEPGLKPLAVYCHRPDPLLKVMVTFCGDWPGGV